MRILFVNGYAFVPQVVGGIEISTFDLCRALQARGHTTAVLCSIVEGDRLWLWNRIKSKVLGQSFPVDRQAGIRVYRGWSTHAGLADIAAREQPDVVIVQGGLGNAYELAARSAQLGYRTFFYMHDLGVILNGSLLPDMRDVRWIANSPFTARTLATQLGVDSAIVPLLFRTEQYRGRANGNYVTMINPRPEKGGDIALDVAELCPDIRFQFVEAWSAGHPDVELLKARAAKLPNVTWLPVQSDMPAIYRATRLLLMPSQCAETWGRVITEAQFLGVPCVVGDLGALPETAGPGGLVVPAQAPAAQWAEAVRRVFADETVHRNLSEGALRHAQRDELNPATAVDRFLAYVQSPAPASHRPVPASHG